MPHNMVTLQAWRLENTNGTHYKQYTVLADSRHVLFFNSRIGNSWVNQTPKAHVSDPLGPDGREFAAPGRKPDKWSVQTEEFATVEEAIARAQEVLG